MAIGNVLRNLGSVLNPQVAQEIGAEERQQQSVAQQLGMFALQQQALDKRAKEEIAARLAIAGKEKQFAPPEVVQLQEYADKLPDGPAKANIQARIKYLTERPDKEPQAPEIVRLQHALSALPTDDPRRKAIADRITMLSTRQPPISVNQFGSPVAGVDKDGNPVFFQPGKSGGAPAIVPGVRPPASKTDEGMSPENAGKVSMSEQAIDGIGTVRKIIFDGNGGINRGVIAAMTLPGVSGMPGNSHARIARSAIRNAIEAKLRIETGAAATESEVERTLARFMPTIADTPESAAFKLNELEKFFKGSLSKTKGVNQPKVEEDPLGIR